jgi:uncharacterized protein YjbI with pentapeptide repeats
MTDFVCDVDEQYRSACEGLEFYAEHDGKRYCVLHFPGGKESTHFQRAISDKLEAGDFNFSGAYFPNKVGAQFKPTSFKTHVDFHGANFEKDANFQFFHGGVTFERAIFKGATSFFGFIRGGAKFDKAIFKGSTSFWGAFVEEATFYEVTFEDDANFDTAQFQNRTSSDGTTSTVGTTFRDATFEGRATFRMATFEGGAEFTGANFRGNADFTWTTFRGTANFGSTSFEGAARFVDTRFSKLALKPEPTAAVTFRGAWIEKPELFSFYRVWLRPSSLFEMSGLGKANFIEVKWYGTLEEEIEIVEQRTRLAGDPNTTEQVVQASPHSLLAKVYRELYRNAEEDRDYPTANEFHFLSMEALRKESWKRLGLVGTLYWALSGYGERPRRAFGVLVGVCAAFAALYMLFGPAELQNLGRAVVYSLGAVARLNPEPKPTEPGLFQFLVIAEGLLGPLQIGLLLLAIRRKVMR